MADINLEEVVINEIEPQPEIVSDWLTDLIGKEEWFHTPLIGSITLSDMIGIVLIIIITTIIIFVLKHTNRRVLMGKVDGANIDSLNKTIRWIIIFIAILVISPYLHLDLSGLMVAGGVVALAISFACQTTLSNLVAGILLMFERPVNIGQDIKIGGNSGYVESSGLLSTYIRTYDGVYVRVPNNTLFNSDITNYAAHVARRFDLQIDISYSEDAAEAEKVILELLDKYAYVLKNPAPSVFVDTLAADGVTLTCRMWTPSTVWLSCKQDLLGKIFRTVADAGIDIPFRQLTLWFGEEEATKIMEQKKLLHGQEEKN